MIDTEVFIGMHPLGKSNILKMKHGSKSDTDVTPMPWLDHIAVYVFSFLIRLDPSSLIGVRLKPMVVAIISEYISTVCRKQISSKSKLMFAMSWQR